MMCVSVFDMTRFFAHLLALHDCYMAGGRNTHTVYGVCVFNMTRSSCTPAYSARLLHCWWPTHTHTQCMVCVCVRYDTLFLHTCLLYTHVTRLVADTRTQCMVYGVCVFYLTRSSCTPACSTRLLMLTRLLCICRQLNETGRKLLFRDSKVKVCSMLSCVVGYCRHVCCY